MGEKANGMNKIKRRIYTDAQTSPMLSGLWVGVSRNTSGKSNGEATYIGVLYTFNKSRPFRLALMKVGPNAGTR